MRVKNMIPGNLYIFHTTRNNAETSMRIFHGKDETIFSSRGLGMLLSFESFLLLEKTEGELSHYFKNEPAWFLKIVKGSVMGWISFLKIEAEIGPASQYNFRKWKPQIIEP